MKKKKDKMPLLEIVPLYSVEVSLVPSQPISPSRFKNIKTLVHGYPPFYLLFQDQSFGKMNQHKNFKNKKQSKIQ